MKKTKMKIICRQLRQIIKEELLLISEVGSHDAGPGSYQPGEEGSEESEQNFEVTDEIVKAGSLAIGTEILSALGPNIFNELVEKIKTYLSNPGSPIVSKISSALENNSELNETINRIVDNLENTSSLREQEEEEGAPELITITSLDDLSEMTVGGQALISQEELDSLRRTASAILVDGLVEGSADALGVEPTAGDWVMAILSNGAREFSFGIIDNIVLVYAGDRIEARFEGKLLRTVKFKGKLYPIAMVGFIAAGLGNAVSDGLGAIVAGPLLDVVGVNPERFVTATQLKNSPTIVRVAYSTVGVVGVVLGCIVGMIPAFFLDSYKEGLVAAGFVWGAEATGLASRVPLIGRVTGAARWLATPVTAMTTAGALTFAGWAIALGTLGWGVVAWAELENRLGRNNAKAFLGAQKKVLLTLGIFTQGEYVDEDGKTLYLRNEITAGDASKFRDKIKSDRANVNIVWKDEMIQLANLPSESFDIPKIKDAVRDASRELGLDNPFRPGSMQSGPGRARSDALPEGIGSREQWMKLAGII